MILITTVTLIIDMIVKGTMIAVRKIKVITNIIKLYRSNQSYHLEKEKVIYHCHMMRPN